MLPYIVVFNLLSLNEYTEVMTIIMTGAINQNVLFIQKYLARLESRGRCVYFPRIPHNLVLDRTRTRGLGFVSGCMVIAINVYKLQKLLFRRKNVQSQGLIFFGW